MFTHLERTKRKEIKNYEKKILKMKKFSEDFF